MAPPDALPHQRLASSPDILSPRRGRERQRAYERHRRRMASPGGERRYLYPDLCRSGRKLQGQEKNGSFSCCTSTTRGHERQFSPTLRSQRASLPVNRHGRERQRVSSPAICHRFERQRAASPAILRGRERRRAPSPVTRRGRECDRAASPVILRGRERRRVPSPATRRGTECDRAASPSIRRGRERDRAACPSIRCGRGRGREGDRAASPTICRIDCPFRDERDGPRDFSRVHDSDGLRPASGRERGVRRPGRASLAADRGNQPPRLTFPTLGQVISPHSTSTGRFSKRNREPDVFRKGKIVQDASIFALPRDLLEDILGMLTPTDHVKLAATSRVMHDCISRAIAVNIKAPFLGAVLVRGQFHRIISFRSGRFIGSAAFVSRSLDLLPKGFKIIDSRNGYLVLEENERFYLWNPFKRGQWYKLPAQVDYHRDKLLSCSLLSDGLGWFAFLLLCEYEQKVVVKTFNFISKSWLRSVSHIELLKANECIPHPSVHAEGYAYYLTSESRIIRVKLLSSTVDVIDSPKTSTYSQGILAKMNGHLCYATAGVADVQVFQYHNNLWQIHWKCQAPRTSLWIKVVGAASENGLLIVETALARCQVLFVETNDWVVLQHYNAGQNVFPLEMNNQFCYPFPNPGLDYIKFKDNDLGTLQRTSNKASNKRIMYNDIKKAIEDMLPKEDD